MPTKSVFANPRCPLVRDKCRSVRPELEPVSDVTVACHVVAEENS